MNFEIIFTPYKARKLTEADVPDILGLYLENNVKKYKHRKAARLKKRAAIPQTSCTHRCELQLFFYAAWFIRDLAPPGHKGQSYCVGVLLGLKPLRSRAFCTHT